MGARWQSANPAAIYLAQRLLKGAGELHTRRLGLQLVAPFSD